MRPLSNGSSPWAKRDEGPEARFLAAAPASTPKNVAAAPAQARAQERAGRRQKARSRNKEEALFYSQWLCCPASTGGGNGQMGLKALLRKLTASLLLYNGKFEIGTQNRQLLSRLPRGLAPARAALAELPLGSIRPTIRRGGLPAPFAWRALLGRSGGLCSVLVRALESYSGYISMSTLRGARRRGAIEEKGSK